MIWFAWTFCGLLNIVGARYMGQYYVQAIQLHYLSGFISIMVALSASTFIWSQYGRQWSYNIHSVVG
jgi:hypothetical protein